MIRRPIGQVLLALTILVLGAKFVEMNAETAPGEVHMAAGAINIKAGDMKWTRMFPEAGDKSSEVCMLHVDPSTGASQLMIRVPPNFHVPKHWHSANETHTILSGTFVMECDGRREVLGPGSFNYMPKTMRHEAWTTADGALLFITVDGAWDIHWVNGPPKPKDLIGALKPLVGADKI